MFSEENRAWRGEHKGKLFRACPFMHFEFYTIWMYCHIFKSNENLKKIKASNEPKKDTFQCFILHEVFTNLMLPSTEASSCLPHYSITAFQSTLYLSANKLTVECSHSLEAPWGKGLTLSHSPLNLVHGRCSVKACWTNEWKKISEGKEKIGKQFRFFYRWRKWGPERWFIKDW